MLATGLDATFGWQTFWRFAAGLLRAPSFSTAGTLAAELFQRDARRNALAIAILFGTAPAWGRAITLLTLIFAVAQIAGPGAYGLRR